MNSEFLIFTVLTADCFYFPTYSAFPMGEVDSPKTKTEREIPNSEFHIPHFLGPHYLLLTTYYYNFLFHSV